jgi:hypothetical protein
VYEYDRYRVLNNSYIKLPYSFEDVSVKPNEFGVADVVNASFRKIYECTQFVKAQTRALSNTTPTEYIGWLGCHSSYKHRGIIWHTANTTPDVSAEASKSIVSPTLPEFNNIIDIDVVDDELYVLSRGDDYRSINLMVDTFNFSFDPIKFETVKTSLGNIKGASSISVYKADSKKRVIYIADGVGNKVYRLVTVLDRASPTITIEESAGGYGLRGEPTRFFSVSEAYYTQDKVYCVDYNNNCIKVLNKNLGWKSTIYLEEFESNKIASATVCLVSQGSVEESLIFVLTETRRIYILNESGEIYNDRVPYYDLLDIPDTQTPKQIVRDNNNSFLYVMCNNYVYKYSVLGLFIGAMENIPYTEELVGMAVDIHSNVYIASKDKVHKVLDIVESHDISHREYDNMYYSLQDVFVQEEELYQDWVVNRSLHRLATNVDLLHRSIHSRFGVSKVNTKYGMQTRFATIPVSRIDVANCDLVSKIGVGVNEMSLSQIYNRDLTYIYSCLESIIEKVQTYLTSSTDNGGECKDVFCWSWKSTKCQDIVSPFMRICDVNPITFKELTATDSSQYTAGEKEWYKAYSSCCTGNRPSEPTILTNLFSGDKAKNNIVNGSLINSTYRTPTGLSVGVDGSIYVCDFAGNIIRRIDNATVSIYTGKATVSGFANGSRGDALYDGPKSSWVNNNSDVYIADYNNHKIRLVSNTGNVTTFADVYTPSAVVATDTNVYVCSYSESLLYKFDISGTLVSTYAALRPQGATIDIFGDVLVTSADNLIYKLNSSTDTISVYAGDGVAGDKNGNRTIARFNNPQGITVDLLNTVYIADTDNHTIRSISSTGMVARVAGSGRPGYREGYEDVSSFNHPTSVLYSPLHQSLFIADTGNNIIRIATILK